MLVRYSRSKFATNLPARTLLCVCWHHYCRSADIGGLHRTACRWPFRCCSKLRPAWSLTQHAHRRAVRIPEQALMREVARRRSSSSTMRLHPMLKSFVSDMRPLSVWASHRFTRLARSREMFRRVRGEGVGPRNLSKICLPDSKFAYEKFAYV